MAKRWTWTAQRKVWRDAFKGGQTWEDVKTAIQDNWINRQKESGMDPACVAMSASAEIMDAEKVAKRLGVEVTS